MKSSEIRKILRESNSAPTERVVKLLNTLEFKNDVLRAGGKIYAVGGIVRDAFMGKESDDLDIVVQGVPYGVLFTILKKYGTPTDTSNENDEKKDFGATKFVSHSKEFNTILKKNNIDKVIDVMLPRKDAKDPNVQGHKGIKSDVDHRYSIEDDLERRDITINAIAVSLDGSIIDKGGRGQEDLKNGVIRAVSEDAFIEDPLRMVRAVRFLARFDYEIDDVTLNLIKNNVDLLSNKEELPAERFLMEFEKMIGKTDLGKAVKILVDMGMYRAIFGVDSKIVDYNKFDKIGNYDYVGNIAEFGYMLFEEQPPKSIQGLVLNNITNNSDVNDYIKALVTYINTIKGTDMHFVKEINELAGVYKTSANMLLNSLYVDDNHRKIAQDFESGRTPKGEHDIALRKEELVDFIRVVIMKAHNLTTWSVGDLKKYGINIGRAKALALQAVYGQVVDNNPEAIKQYMIDSKHEWLK